MRGIILAAGRGSRLKNLTKNNPKCLIKIKNETILNKIINNFKINKIFKIIIITGYKNNLIKKKNFLEIHNVVWKKSNMLYSLFLADQWLCKYDCVVSYSDIIYHSDAIKMLKKDRNKFSLLSIKNWKKIWTLRFQKPLEDIESFEVDKRNILKNIGKRVNSMSEVKGQYSGLFKITPKIWKKIRIEILKLKEQNLFKLDMTNFFQILIKKNFKIKVINYDKHWFEIDTKLDLEIYEKL
jgi:choline kinase